MTRFAVRAMARGVLLFIASARAAIPAAGIEAPVAPTGLQREVVFTEYSDYSRSEEVVRRLFSPLNGLRINREATRLGKTLREQAVDLASERFAIYTPPNAPTHGYGLMVFVPPWSSDEVPPDWTAALDSHGMLFVSAANSGNDANVFDRREPLALLAVRNMEARYRIDPQRVYIGGFSGGSRVALRLALGYPDLFRGVLLNAGSDPIGDEHVPLPPADLFHRFQESTRVVYVTGEHDAFHINEDVRSRQSMQAWCVSNVLTVIEPWGEHKPAQAPAFARALDLLMQAEPVDAGRLARCRERVEGEMAARLQEVEGLQAQGKQAAALRLLNKIDQRFGGLAAPRSVALEGQ
ncbi:MAG TPA: alpha/beta hydrolase [Steroidobacteraceae bacterium]|nr:alpha/beta hydrolase [Steroidobacteraceae bacterium]